MFIYFFAGLGLASPANTRFAEHSVEAPEPVAPCSPQERQKTWRRCHSDTDVIIKSAMCRAESDGNLIGDYTRAHSLPTTQGGKHRDLKYISPETLAQVVRDATTNQHEDSQCSATAGLLTTDMLVKGKNADREMNVQKMRSTAVSGDPQWSGVLRKRDLNMPTGQSFGYGLLQEPLVGQSEGNALPAAVSQKEPAQSPKHIIIDCRYPYEYDGGHIKGAINLFTKEQINDFLKRHYKKSSTNAEADAMEKFDSIARFSQQFRLNYKTNPVLMDRVAAVGSPLGDQTDHPVLIFHCEYSSERGPKLARFIRSQDRELNR